MKLSKEEINLVKKQLGGDDPDRVTYLRQNRFSLNEPVWVETSDGRKTRISRCRLFDGQCDEVELSKEYHLISRYIGGVSVVRISTNINFEDGRSHIDSKYGMIDLNGHEIVPCIYDRIDSDLDGRIELRKDGLRKLTSSMTLLNGTFSWEEALPLGKY
jgi:hypothetical protein